MFMQCELWVDVSRHRKSLCLAVKDADWLPDDKWPAVFRIICATRNVKSVHCIGHPVSRTWTNCNLTSVIGFVAIVLDGRIGEVKNHKG